MYKRQEQDIVGVNDVVMLVLVVGAVAAHQQGGALGDVLPLGAVLPLDVYKRQQQCRGSTGDEYARAG